MSGHAEAGNVMIFIFLASIAASADLWQLVEMARHNDIVMIHTYDPFECALPPPGYYRLTDGEHSVGIDTSISDIREQYRVRYDEQQQALRRLCNELGLFQIDIATDGDMIAELKSGLGMQGR